MLRSHDKTGIVVALAMWACGCIDPQVPPVVEIAITPVAGNQLYVGERVTLTATVTGTLMTAVFWRSTSPDVISVDHAGLIIARDSGVAWIVATSQLDSAVRDSVRFDVDYLVIAPPPGPSITVESIVTTGTNIQVDRMAVAGSITVTTSYDLPPVTTFPAIRIRLNDQNVCQTQLTDRRGSVQCAIDTNASVNGQRLFPNGPATLRAQLITEAGLIQANVTLPLVLSN